MGKLVNFLGGDKDEFQGEDLAILQEFIMQQVLEGQNRDARRATKAARRAKREARKSSAAVGPEGIS